MKLIYALFAVSMISTAAVAQDVNYDAMQKEGFGDEAEILKSMTPEQRAEVMRQAAVKEQELKQMPPEKVEKLKAQLHETHDTLNVDQIDPAKLDTTKIKSTPNTMKDMKVYKKKYAEGKIHNSAVKQRDDQQ